MKFLLDTNAVIALMQGNIRLTQRMTLHEPVDFALPAIVAHELHYGVHKSERRAANLERVEALRFAILEFDADDARESGRIRAELAKSGQPIGPYDVLIAGQALSRGLTLISNNLREFTRVQGLKVEDWQ